jgi:MFS family permease
LAPHDGNPSYNSAGEQCPIQDHVAPPIPKSLNISISDNTLFDYDEYRFKYLSKSDIQCHDNFWAEACTMNYCRDQSEATEKAGFYMSIPYFFTVALTFHLGLLVDKTGWRTEMITLGSLLLVLAHVLLAFPFTSPPVVPLVSQGLGYTVCVAALWPSVPYTVSPDSVGTAFGIMMSVQNVGLALIPLLVADLYGRSNNHYLPWVELFFATISLLAVIVAIALMIADKRTNHILGTPKIDIRFNERNEPVIVNHIRARALSDANLYH